ncbi:MULTISPECIES: Na+/H+ antiporter Mnh2 subunit E [Staphylococcus]|jgi:multicomponent Na+:H+ antiporter subunit E|uniref:Monovalent cation/H+ antiporter subunit E n=1 Tax=Staphylococcus nepalensis TaxID=214473 RepID=A0A291JM34_9STAP|nr:MULTISPECIES: Na+/H+ antiporter Mnh2 subunit E [Staphylococcus]VDG67923.1 Multiple resistance and pH homeostasis protein E [Lacrimispora indolis]ATH60924.1 Na+/H+ antiporter subunit E [Staphylococcus nepalensis]ATH65956.1 Na+/H+ antiporter subunit E [Staphylococcus nepalensis]AWI45345.1 Na+/H+ antiporter subunit E [Staphylococcus nepalensis]MBO1206492.1 Na+/H+ antiporter Mnh2 subunit E [Staphylococcus nepalensis]
MRQVLLNMVIAFLWVLFQDEESFRASTFFSGYLIGLVVIYILHRFFGQQFYLKKVWVAIKFLAVYLYQLITSSMTTINYILFKTKDLNPGLVTYETTLETDWEVSFLTILIIITPGSTVIRISKERKKIFIHAIDISEKEKQKLLKSIRQYEGLILEVAE